MYTIRKAAEQDLELLLMIDRMSCEREHYPWQREKREPLLRTFVEGEKGFGFVAEKDGNSLGAIMVRISNSSDSLYTNRPAELLRPLIGDGIVYADIFDIWIDPLHRRMHTATALKNALEEECRARGIEWIFTFQHPENIAAIRMNETLAYQHIGEARIYDDVVRVCFLKRIEPAFSPS